MSGTPGKIVISRDSGKREVRNATGKVPVFNAVGECECCDFFELLYFRFQQIGFNSFSSTTYYDYGSFPAGFTWEVLNAGPHHFRMKLAFEDDDHCGSTNPNAQLGRVKLGFILRRQAILTVDWEGMVENVPHGSALADHPRDTYDYDGNHPANGGFSPDYMHFFQGSANVAHAYAPGIDQPFNVNGDGGRFGGPPAGDPNPTYCGNLASPSSDTPPPRSITGWVLNSPREVSFEVGTVDEFFNNGVYYILDLLFEPA